MTNRTMPNSSPRSSIFLRSSETSKSKFPPIKSTFSNLSFLGISSKGVSVNEVELPGWAKNEHDFVRVHRECLESKHVARKLRYWVDLLFGSKQKDESNFNVFFGYAYESYVRSKQDEIEIQNIHTILEFM